MVMAAADNGVSVTGPGGIGVTASCGALAWTLGGAVVGGTFGGPWGAAGGALLGFGLYQLNSYIHGSIRHHHESTKLIEHIAVALRAA
jgi:hypothetical protein